MSHTPGLAQMSVADLKTMIDTKGKRYVWGRMKRYVTDSLEFLNICVDIIIQIINLTAAVCEDQTHTGLWRDARNSELLSDRTEQEHHS